MGNQIQHKVHFIVRGHKMGNIRHGDAKIGHLDIGRRRPDERIIGRKVRIHRKLPSDQWHAG